jgi:hypothetical protein
LFCALLAWRSARDVHAVARQIETKYPELVTGLLAAIEQAEPTVLRQRGFLQTAVLEKVLAHKRAHDWNGTVTRRSLWTSYSAQAASAILCFAVFVALLVHDRADGVRRPAQITASSPRAVRVEPGNTSLERGSALLVVARFEGAVPPDATLVIEVANKTRRTVAMGRSLQDPTFAARVEGVTSDLAYHVSYQGRSTEIYTVRVFEYPELERADAKLVFPGYTSLEPKTVEDIRHVTAVEGTELTLNCRLNKDVAGARLVDEQGQATALTRVEGKDPIYRTGFILADTKRYRVRLVDREGRTNKLAAELVVNVTRNRPPVITLSQPARDVRVSPVEEVRLKAQVEDDFGVVGQGLNYTLAGQEPRDIPLMIPKGTDRRVKAEHVLELEKLRAAPDELVSYFFWADDIGPDGKRRRTAGDMFFAEVRHFEEIFRQGEQPPSGSAENQMDGAGNMQETDRLAELQKEVVNATWKLIRREQAAKPSDRFVEDSKLVQESQHKGIEQAGQLAQRLQDATSKASLSQATGFMHEAETHLAEAVRTSSVKPHSPALVAERAAYQALLKLRAREFQVIRNNSRQRGRGGSGGGSPSSMQLEQLELSADENRYEEQARARNENASAREREQRENRQVLNRLRELAQRQMDLNQRIKELQAALEAANTVQAREEVARQLKRLREQQQELLRDTDELRERTEREENRERMADARRQIEESREHVRQASRALEEGRLSQAVTEGARAGRQLNDLREELRKAASSRFSEEMTDMRSQARRLDENQGRLTQQLDDALDRTQRSLRDSGQRQQTRQELDRQRQGVERMLDRMRRTVEDAEETEPLLARQLFDTARKANERTIPDTLKGAEQLVEAGITEEAAKASRSAGQGIEEMRKGVERAAESVLGDETAALRRAQGELQNLGDEIDRELAQAAGPNETNPRNMPAGSSPRRVPEAEKAAVKSEPGDAEQKGASQPKDTQAKRGSGSLRGENDGQGGQGQAGGARDLRQRSRPQAGSQLERALEGFNGGPGGPITGEGFRPWSDRMRDVEELLEDPELRAEAARIRDRVRGAREDFKRHAKVPDWNKLQQLVAEPLHELRKRVDEEVRRRESPDSLVPIDRDPVPPQFAEGVRRYYERLGSGR